MIEQSALNTAALAISDPGERAAAENLAALTPAPARQGAATGLLADPAYQAAMERALAAKTSAATNAAVAEMEAIALQRFPGDAPPAELESLPELHQYVTPTEVARAFDSAEDHAVMKEAVRAAGVPPELYAPVATMLASKRDVLDDSGKFDSAVLSARSALQQQYPAGAHVAVVNDAMAYFDALERAQPALRDAISLLCTDAWAISTAANLHRSGAKPR